VAVILVVRAERARVEQNNGRGFGVCILAGAGAGAALDIATSSGRSFRIGARVFGAVSRRNLERFTVRVLGMTMVIHHVGRETRRASGSVVVGAVAAS
jgi:hypothetical protein